MIQSIPRFFAILTGFFLGTFWVYANEVIEPTTGMIFPEKIGNWTRTSYRDQKEPQFGFSAVYGYESEWSAITCRVYDGWYGSPKDDPASIKKEMERIVFEMGEVWKERGAKIKEIVPITEHSSEGNSRYQFVMVHVISFPERDMLSLTHYLFLDGKYISFRFSTANIDTDLLYEKMGEFLTDISILRKKRKAELESKDAK